MSLPSLFALSAAVVVRHDMLEYLDEALDEDTKLRVQLAARRLNCVECGTPCCQNHPEKKECGLCLLPLCDGCNDQSPECDGCGVTLCELCLSTEADGHAKHHELWDLAGGGRPISSYSLGWPPPNSRHSIDCKTCGKLSCWYCWQALAVDHKPENAGWMCDVCNSNQCSDCVFVVDSVGLPKLAHCFEPKDVNMLCHGCLKADRGRYRLTPSCNWNTFVDSDDDDDDDDDYEEETARCGQCGERSSTELIFCPNCGA